MPEYRNPQNDPGAPMDTKRLMMVFIVTFVMMFLAQQFLFKKQEPSPSAQEAAKQQQQPAQQPAAAGTPATLGTVMAAKTAPGQPAAAPVSVKQATAETETVVENDLYKITFTNKGAQVKSWILKKYKDEAGNPLELVHTQAAATYGYPLSLWTWDQATKDKLNTSLYVADATGHIQAPHTTINFEFSDGDLTVKKTFTFDHSYVVTVDTQATRSGATLTALPSWPAGFGDATILATYAAQRIDYQYADTLERLKADKKGKEISSGNVIQGPISWGGSLDQYFAAVFLPDKPKSAVLVTLRNSIEIPKDAKHPDKGTDKVEVLGSAVGTLNGSSHVRLFTGPKDIDILKSVKSNGPDGQTAGGPDLQDTLDFGMFRIIARPLFLWAKWTQQHWVNNWGLCIVVLTIIINLVLLPLRVSSMKSMLKMQKIAPQMDAVKKKYEKFKINDPRRQEMNTEMWALQKEHGVNPLGGCLPIVIQMPFLFAFYAMLANVTELRQAHFLWINDLSSPDRLYIIPILVVATQMILQRMSPQGGMPAEQQRMMNLMMPLMIGLFSWSVASGLGVYWVTGVLVMIVQQSVMNRTELGREIRAAAIKRQNKK